MKKIKKRKSKKLFLKVEYTTLELQDTEETAESYKQKFTNDFQSELAYLAWLDNQRAEAKKAQEAAQPKEKGDEGNQEDNDEILESSSAEKKPKVLQTIYRSIAKKTHPDICEDEELHEMFREAQEAYDQLDWIKMISIANKLDLDIPELPEDIELLIEENIENANKKIKKMKNTISWVWSDAADKEENSSELRANIRMQLGIDPSHYAAWLRDKHKSNS
jgi:hypothetical protein